MAWNRGLRGGSWQELGPVLAMLAALGAWLWPIGVGGRMPVGGDATQFSIGLMAVLARALRAGQLPWWNDLWGYGFPGVAESQMGVYYPPHLLLYGLLPVEAAYTASLVGHLAWGALGTFVAARVLGISPKGAALCGWCWSASGFFEIHLAHQWAYTTGSWMPWAWAAAWRLGNEGDRVRGALRLAAVLALQVLPGHFQLAFATQVGVLGIALAALVRRRPRGSLAVVAGWLGALPLAAAQLGPTLLLARRAGAARDFEYLSAFAATPVHLVQLVAPGLFERSPLWRPVAWDPWHAMPEEPLAYVGLVPLFLALGSLRRGFRADPAVRTLAALGLGALLLALGPYVPGFRALIALPGFSFFRAPARWGLALELALALLAGKGLDAWEGWPRKGRALVRFAVGAAAVPAAAVLGFELALAASGTPGAPAVATVFESVLRARPWQGEPGFEAVLEAARRPQVDLRVLAGLARQGIDPKQALTRASETRLDRQRAAVYVDELWPTAVLLLALLPIALVAPRWPKGAMVALLALSAVDLLTLNRLRAVDTAPIRPLTEQSKVLGWLAGLPRGTRSVDPLRNLPMVAGAAPVSAYRTLDLPVVPDLTAATFTAGRGPIDTGAALRAVGAGARILDPFDAATGLPGDWDSRRIDDPELAAWLFGRPLAQGGLRPPTFTAAAPAEPPARAWLIQGDVADWSSDRPETILRILRDARPLEWVSANPGRVEIEAEGPGTVVLAQLDDPQWRARWEGAGGPRSAVIERAFAGANPGAWQRVELPGPGRWRLRLGYEPTAERAALGVSAVAWGAAFLAYWWAWRRVNGRRTG